MSTNWSANSKAFESLLEAIGRTPMVKLQNIPKDAGIKATIYAKLDYLNPSGSLKDRVYYRMITEAIKRGDLKPGMEIIEVSTGNAGIACTWIGTLLGYKVTIVMPAGMSEERKKLIRALGGNIIETPGAESDADISYEVAMKMYKEHPEKYWFPDQYSNPDAVAAHHDTTGAEIWEQTGGKVDALVLTQGTGGTLTGAGRYLREKNPKVKLYAVEPTEAPMLSKRKWGSHKIEGIGDGFVPRNLDVSMLDGVVTVSSDEAIYYAKQLMLKEKILAGISSGANVAAAIKVAKKHPELKHIVVMMNDSAMRYFTTELFDVKKVVEIPEREHPIDEYTKEQLDKYQSKWEIIE
ncbi:MAG: cysteine synthase family protein [Nitrososphaeria archaeon]|jgi:cysteine synthase A|nr:pyridoxal-phosphate dependent enzyme [Nitrososphaerota archaeon]